MPSTYAHYSFGNDVLHSLPEDLKRDLVRCRSMYDIGVHGPDLLFYYRPLSSNPINSIGFNTHEKSGRVFFEHAATVVRQSHDFPAAMAYAKGLITHFALDRICHPYVEESIQGGSVTHAEVEVSFDRFLLIKDGFDPTNKKLCGHIEPSAHSAAVIAPFFQPVTAEQVLLAEKSIIRYNDLLVSPHRPKRFLIKAVLTLSGNGGQMNGLLITKEQNKKCVHSDRKLYELYQQALLLTRELFDEMDAYLDGSGPLGKAFDHTFDVN